MDRRWILAWVVVAFVSIGAVGSASADPPHHQRQFVPKSRAFWDNSKHWTTNYGPAYRDTSEQASQLLACTTKFALCFHSGPEPYPCKLTPNKRSAKCQCTVATETNYTVITSILNYPVYLKTVQVCGADGSGCPNAGDAPVCKFLEKGKLIPGADVISTFDITSHNEVLDALATGPSAITSCEKAPYAACMTAPCHLNADGTTATCKCPVFYGKFNLIGAGAQCSLGGNLVPSAAYYPALDENPFN
jgi:hypothetical protein